MLCWPRMCGYWITMLNRFVAATACLIFIICATLSSDGARPDLTGDETARVVFIGAYALLGTPLYIAYPRHLGLVCLLVLGSTMAGRPRRA